MTIRILFICGNLEMGKSGVADYVLLLAGELSRQGVTCACVSIHDAFCPSFPPSSSSHSLLNGIEVARISSSVSWRRRSTLLLAEVESFRPDWISLQYVPYAFNSKGLSFRLIHCLSAVQPLADWQIMAHELWLDPNFNIKHRLLSLIQRFIFLALFRRLHPRVIHTSNSCYQAMLSRSGIKSNILPIFSNIPICPDIGRSKSSHLVWSFIVFGSIHKEWDPWSLLTQIEAARRYCSVESCNFFAIGNIGSHGITLWDSLQALSYPRFNFYRLGELPADNISHQLQRADFGISLSPSHLLDKSGSVAAMVAHGLPVIVTRLTANCDKIHQTLKESGKYILLDSSFVNSLANAKKFSFCNSLEDTASVFLKSLKSAL